MRASVSFLFVVFCCLLVAVASMSPKRYRHKQQQQNSAGVSTFVEERSLNYVAGQILPLLRQKVLTLPIPGIEITVSGLLGHLDLFVTDVQITDFVVGTVSIQVVQNTGLQVIADNVQVAIHANWRYREREFPHVSDSGSMDAHTTVSCRVLVHAGTDGQRLQVDIDKNVYLAMSDFDVTMHGGASWLYNIILGLFKGSIRNSIHDALVNELTGDLNAQLKSQVATIPYNVQLDPRWPVNLDFSAMQTTFNSSTPALLAVGAKGEFVDTNGEPYNGPSSPYVPYQQLTSTSPMISIFLTDYVLNTAGWAFYQSGALLYALYDSDIPQQIPFRLNTKSFAVIAPGLALKYPDTPMQLVIKAVGNNINDSPKANITTSGATLTVRGDAVFNVIVNDTVTEAFTLGVFVVLEVSVDVQGGRNITGKLLLDDLVLSVASSNVGDIQVQALNTFVGSILKFVVVPYVNTIFAQGIPIPTIPGLTLVNSVVVFRERFIGISSDFTFTPEPQLWSGYLHAKQEKHCLPCTACLPCDESCCYYRTKRGDISKK